MATVRKMSVRENERPARESGRAGEAASRRSRAPGAKGRPKQENEAAHGTSESAIGAGARLRSLLVPVDLTPLSDRILGRTALLSLARDATVTLMHVVPASLPSHHRRGAERDARRLLRAEASRLSRSLPSPVRIDFVVKVGSAAGEIDACAAANKAEMIVMGRGGGRALRDAFLGSTAERVIRRSRLPVLAVRLNPRTAYRRPALVLDLDEVAPHVLAWLLRVVPSPPPRLHVIHAVDSPYRGFGYPSRSEAEVEEQRAHLRREASARLSSLLAAALEPDGAAPQLPQRVRWKAHVHCGSPRSVVAKAIRRGGFDLAALGTHARTGFSRAFLGTVAGDVLRDVNSDVLVVPPPASTSD